MKTIFKLMLPVLLVPAFLVAQKPESQYIQWTGNDTIANAMVWRGIDHLMNIEFEKAYTFFDAAVLQDPSLFAPHVVLANFSGGDKKKHHVAEAQKLVTDKNEVSKMYVSLLDIDWKDEGAADKRSATWAKMYELAYNGAFVNFNYAMTRKDAKDRMMELNKLAEKLESSNRNSGHVHNILGYMYYDEGDKAKAKAHLEKYLELRPKGYNAYDSMGEYYFNEGDMETALAYYKKARMHYPAARSANDKIKEIEEKMPAKEKEHK